MTLLIQIKYFILFWRRCSTCKQMDGDGYCSRWKVHPAKYQKGKKTYCRHWEKIPPHHPRHAYQPHGKLDLTNPPQGGSGVPRKK